MAKKIKIEKDELEYYNKEISKDKLNNKKKFKLNKKVLVIGIFCVIVILLFLINIFKIFRPSLESIKDSVVKIEVYDSNGELSATGSGFCAYKSNYIITNFHVIEGAYNIKVISDDKSSYNVKNIIVFNQKEDLAIIDVDGDFKTLKINISGKNKVKDKVTAIGSPKGELNTVSEGIISNVDEKKSIRISVPISHGSSGGVLLNNNYEIIGITNAGYDDAENLNFAISSSTLEKMYNNYKDNKYGEITSSNYKDCAPNIINYNTQNQLKIKNKCNFSDLNVYTTDSIESFYKATNNYEIFNTAMYKLGIDGLNVNYKKLSKEDQKLASEYYTALLDYEDCDANNEVDCSIDNISSWNKEQMVMELDIMQTYALAIFEVEIDKYNVNNIFNYVNSLPLGIPEKGILLLLYGGYTPKRLNNTDAQNVITYINDLSLSVDEKGKILSYLGYSVNGSNVNW